MFWLQVRHSQDKIKQICSFFGSQLPLLQCFNGSRRKCSVSCWDDKPVWGFDTMSWSFSKDAPQKRLTADVLGKNFRLFFLLFSQAKVFREVYMAYWVFNISATHYLQLSSFDLETIPTKTWLIPHEAWLLLRIYQELVGVEFAYKMWQIPLSGDSDSSEVRCAAFLATM